MRSHEVLLCSISVALMAVAAEARQTEPRPAPGAANPAAANQQGARPKVFCKASDLIKYDVENDKGDDLGDVKEILFDPANERVAMLVVSYGGVLGMGDKLYAVPWSAFTLPQDSKKIILKIDKEQIKKAPQIDAGHWPDTLDDRLAADLGTFYSISPYWKDAPSSAGGPPPTDPAAKKGTFLRRATVILDAKVENDAGDKLGEVEDLAIGAEEGRVLYGVLSFGGVLGMGEKYFAIPISAFDLKAQDPEKLVLHIDKEKLKKAPGFDKGAWPNMADDRWVGEIHTFYEQKPYWERNKPRSP